MMEKLKEKLAAAKLQARMIARSAMNGNMLTIGGLFVIVIFAVLQLALAGTINSSSSTAANTTNDTTAKSIYNLYPAVYAIVGIIALLAAFGLA